MMIVPKTAKDLAAMNLKSMSHRQLQDLAGAIKKALRKRTPETDVMGLLILAEMWSDARCESAK